MALHKIIALEGEPQRAAALQRALAERGGYDAVVSASALALMELMDGRGDVRLVITNTRVNRDESDGLRFIKALHAKYQGFQTPLPPILVCSAEQAGQIVPLYAFRFSQQPLVNYVLIPTAELESDPSRLLLLIADSLAGRAELEASLSADPGPQVKARLRDQLRSTVSLPHVPDVALKVLQAVREPEVTFRKLAQVISTDLSLGANIVRLANSPVYGVSGKIATLEEACKQIGLNAIANMAVATKVFDALDTAAVDYDTARLRRHSFAVATIARLLGRRCHALGDVRLQIEFSGTMFAAGLLHDIGKVLIALFFAEAAEDVAARIAAQGCPTVQAEIEVLGVSHTDTGLLAGLEWSFPPLLVNVIGGHHMRLEEILGRLKGRQGRAAQRLIRIADAASYEMGFGMAQYEQAAPALDPAYFDRTGLTEAEFLGWTRELRDDIVFTFEALGRG